MRLRGLILSGLIAVTACTGTSSLEQPTTTSPPGTVTTTAATTTTMTVVPPVTGPIRGALPNGTIYDIAFPTARHEEVGEIHARIVAEIDGDDIPLDVSFERDGNEGSGEVYAFSAGEWTVSIEIPEAIGDDAREVISDGIDVSTEVEMPVLILRPPLRWAGAQEVGYDTFVVRNGCPETAAACNQTHAVAVIPRPGVTLERPVSVQSYALRPTSDPDSLDPGPLTARWSPDVLWSGSEMIVWGGSTTPGPPHLIDGAAFDPATGEWRMLSGSPLVAEQPTRALWADGEMIVIAEEATAAWDPASDEWRVMAAGIVPPIEPGLAVWTGSEVITWTADGVHQLLTDGIDWALLADPGVGEPGLQGSVLRVAGSRLLAIGQDACDRLVTQWDREEWSEPARIHLGESGPSCGHPNQSGVVDGNLVIWDDTSEEVVSHDLATGATMELAHFPLPETDHAPGPLHLDGRFLVTAGLDGAIFDPVSRQWTTVHLPGLGTDVDMVWTGEEVLMWDKCCFEPGDVDAWRWVPPSR